jgi:hypothetical protein
MPQLADIIILAVLAVEIAPSEEDSAGSLVASQWILFPEVRTETGHYCTRPGLAGPQLCVAIYVALPATEVAVMEVFAGDLRALLQFT